MNGGELQKRMSVMTLLAMTLLVTTLLMLKVTKSKCQGQSGFGIGLICDVKAWMN
jgi:hypothetical protein